MPSAFSTRRTVVSDTPIPKNRLIRSRIRRLPAPGSASRVATIARLFTLAGFLRFGRCDVLLASSETSPCSRYACTHCTAVV